MIERQKPKPPNKNDLWLEKQAEMVTLLDRDTMLERLLEVTEPRIREDVEKNLFPSLLRYAGQTFPLSRVPSLIIQAVHEYAGTEQKNFRYFLSEHAPTIISAMLEDKDDRERVHEFLVEALNG